MPLEAPNLDDRRFADLFAELKGMIPRYAPEWTDHNLSDPGITLLQLFAWLGDILIYRLNRIPERHYLKFLQLLGIELQPATPARADLTFTPASPDLTAVIVPAGTQVAAAAPAPAFGATAAEETPLVFTTQEPLTVIGATLAKVQVFDGKNYLDYSAANQPSGSSYPAFGDKLREGSALMLGFASANAWPQGELALYCRLAEEPSVPQPTFCPGTGPGAAPATVAWEFWDGGRWRSLLVLRDSTFALRQTGYVHFQGPKELRRAKLGGAAGPQDPELYWLRVRLIRGDYDRPPQVDAVLTNTVPALAVNTVRDEVVGSSNGQPEQIFQLRQFPVFAAPPRTDLPPAPPGNDPRAWAAWEAFVRQRELEKGFLLEIDEGQGWQPWIEVADFALSRPEDRHYILQRAAGVLRFGRCSRIPTAGINNIVARFYRYGGGNRGNVGAGTIKELQSYLAGVTAVTNYYPAVGGADEETVAEAKLRAPQEIRTRDRAVTAADFEFLARQTPGVRLGRVKALPLFHPRFPGEQIPGVVTVIVVPETPEPSPQPSEATRRAVCDYLRERRLLTTEVIVTGPLYRQVKVEVQVVAAPTADAAAVRNQIAAALDRFLHPLTGGADGQGWPFGGDVYFSDIFRLVLQVEGVQTVEDVRLVVDGRRYGRCENASIGEGYLIAAAAPEIVVTYATASGAVQGWQP